MPLYSIPIVHPRKKMGRNEKCWCGSGKKYKHCHLDKEAQKTINPYQFWNDSRKSFARQYCSHPEASPSTCDKIIKSHTISKSTCLKSISEKGHVYNFSGDFNTFEKNNGITAPKKIGLNNASTFTGFCGHHDNKIFRIVDTNEISASDDFIFFLSYRVVCFELFQKESELNFNELCKNLDSGKSLTEQVDIQTMIKERIRYNRIALNEARAIKENFDNMLINNDYKKLNYISLKIDSVLPVVVAGGRFPDYDFSGNELFSLELSYDDPPVIQLNIINDGKSSLITLTWTSQSERNIDFAEDFIDKIKSKGLGFAVHVALATCENAYCKISWWDSLPQKTKTGLLNDIVSDVSPMVPRWYKAIQMEREILLAGTITEIKREY
ncbi:YecA family protein [Hwanghaeella sp. LZ110]|uniref:YecA family protein n=1 Tax=Hwanghaeella sp. LZ110 TaxID=3402810 RepID=UPI003B675709